MVARHSIWLCLILAGLLGPAPRAAAADYFVDPGAGDDGNDGSNVIYRCRAGGPAEPWWPDGNYYLTFETYHAFADNKWKVFPNDNSFHHNLILHAGEQGDRPGEDPLLYYDANVLIVEALVSFAEGDPVSLPWNGPAPDLGVSEFSR